MSRCISSVSSCWIRFSARTRQDWRAAMVSLAARSCSFWKVSALSSILGMSINPSWASRVRRRASFSACSSSMACECFTCSSSRSFSHLAVLASIRASSSSLRASNSAMTLWRFWLLTSPLSPAWELVSEGVPSFILILCSSSCSRRIRRAVGSSLTVGLLKISRTRDVYLSVFRVSSKFRLDGDTQATIIVREFPPRESDRSDVRVESRYGTWAAPSTSASMTRPRHVSERLMPMLSFIRSPWTRLAESFSLPARSTRFM
mmetsp:Transcript_55299/g.98428  ORF Transcript_55299/g.98428 Transcript_55299/m.98428 type:complete len:261 (-) Transcript_55299:301-1083(-)